jgi:hypothetical protein
MASIDGRIPAQAAGSQPKLSNEIGEFPGLRVQLKIGAGDRGRTGDVQLGKHSFLWQLRVYSDSRINSREQSTLRASKAIAVLPS